MGAEMLAHRIASEFVDRERRHHAPLGRDSLYNAVREAAIEVLAAEPAERPACDCRPHHLIDCPAYGEGADRRTRLWHHIPTGPREDTQEELDAAGCAGVGHGYWLCDVIGGCSDCRAIARDADDVDMLSEWDAASADKAPAEPTVAERLDAYLDGLGI